MVGVSVIIFKWHTGEAQLMPMLSGGSTILHAPCMLKCLEMQQKLHCIM